VAEPLLRIRGLAKHYGGLKALDGIDLDVDRGAMHALIGPNGAGKTTLVHGISGAMACDAGTIELGDCRIEGWPMHRRVGAGLVRSHQVASLFTHLSALDNVALAVQARAGSSFRFWAPAAGDRHMFDAAGHALAQVGLSNRAGTLAAALSHGEQRRLELAMVLATGARLLLLDEPMAGMGPEESGAMVALIAGLRPARTILLVEHDMDAVFRLADRISVLVDGRVLATGTPDAIRANAEVRRAYLGEDLPA